MTEPAYCYAAYGLCIGSSMPLPELAPARGQPDVVIDVDRADAAAAPLGRAIDVRLRDGETELAWERAGRVRVTRGRRIVVEPAPDADERALRHLLLGPAMAALMVQRGLLVLHASAVRIDERAVGFLGGPGWGKSTTAAALHRRGHPVVSDDVLPVDVRDERALAIPAGPYLKLWPETAARLGDLPDDLAPVYDGVPKRLRPVRDFAPAPLPLARLYLLTEGDAVTIDATPPRNTVIELLRHSWGSRALRVAADPAHLERYAALARSVSFRRLAAPRSLEGIADLAALVEQDVRGAATR